MQAGLGNYLLTPTKAVPNSYELFLSGVRLNRELRQSWDPEYRGIHLLKSTDNEIHNVIVHGAGVGVEVGKGSGSSNFSNIHVWGYGATKAGVAPAFPAQLPTACFLDRGRGTSWVTCTADSASKRGFDLQCDSTRLTNCRAFSNWYVDPGTADAIHIEFPAARISVTNCQIVAIPGHEFRYDIAVPEGNPDPLISGSNVFSGNTCAATDAVGPGMPIGAIKRRLNVRVATDSARLAWVESSGQAMFTKDYATKTIQFSGDNGAITPGTAAGPGASIVSGKGSPAGVVPGAAGDLYVDKTGPKGKWLYRCDGGKNWTAML